MNCDCADRQDVIDVLNRYASCLDERRWAGLDEVFTNDAIGDYGTTPIEGRAAIVKGIRRSLDGCGPSQHLLGNYTVRLDGDEAETWTRARVFHMGAGDRASLEPYESIGVYHDHLRRTADGWRIVHRRYDEQITLGDRRILAPA